MSGLFGSAAGPGCVFFLTAQDERLQPPEYKTLGVDLNAQMPADHADILWPRSQMTTALGGGALLNPDHAAQMWEWNVFTTGSRHRKVITGQTLNSAGAALGGCTVMLFNASTGLLVDTQTSDSAGNYKVTDPNNVASFVVAYLPGSPDVAGTTVNTLTGS